MDKIKSSRELAMERTAHLAAAGREALAFEQQKYVRAAAVLAASLLSEKIKLEQALESIERYPQDAAGKARLAFIKAIVEGMEPGNIAQAVEALIRCRCSAAEEGRLVDAAAAIRQRYRDSMAAIRSRSEMESRASLLEQLGAAGIRGSAVDGANPQRSAWYKEETARASAACAAELEGLKQEFLLQLEKNTAGGC